MCLRRRIVTSSHLAADPVKHQLIVNLTVEQQRLGVCAFNAGIEPVPISGLVKDDRHSRMNMGDVIDRGRGDDRTAGHSKLVVMRPKAANEKPLPSGICNSDGSFLPSSALVVHSK